MILCQKLCINKSFSNKAPTPAPLYMMLQGVNNMQSSKLVTYAKKETKKTEIQKEVDIKKNSYFDDLKVDFKKVDFEFRTSLINLNIERSTIFTEEFRKAFKQLISNPNYIDERHLDKKDEFGKVVLRFLKEAEGYCENTLHKLNDIKMRLN